MNYHEKVTAIAIGCGLSRGVRQDNERYSARRIGTQCAQVQALVSMEVKPHVLIFFVIDLLARLRVTMSMLLLSKSLGS